MTKLLIDGDILLYRACAINEGEIDWGDDCASQVADLSAAKRDLDRMIRNLLVETGCDEYVVVLSTTSEFPNFRYDVLPTYKHNRDPNSKPKLLPELRAYAEQHHPTECYRYLEGDDVIGILATEDPDNTVIASIDKDLLQIPGMHWDWNKKDVIEVDALGGDRWFFTQILTGDPTDGYKGCPGIGPKKAAKILAQAEEGMEPGGLARAVWPLIVEAYEKKGLSEEDAIRQARVARILQCTDYDDGVILWKPQQ